MKNVINKTYIEGLLYEHTLELKTSGPNSKTPGTQFITGTISIATDDACVNIVPVHFTYVTATTSKGNANATFTTLKNIIDGVMGTIMKDGKDKAGKLRIDSALGLNEFYTDRNGKEELVSAKRNEGGFVHVVDALNSDEKSRNTFECDMLINGTKIVEKDEERNIDEDYLIVKGAVFNFRNAIQPVEFVVKNPGGIKYFESLEASPSNLVFTKVWGTINSETIVTKREEESAFGESAVKEYERKVREWVITGTAKETYEIGDEQTGITMEEIQKAMTDRNTYLADVKKRQDEYQASKASAPAAPKAGITAAQGGFNF